MYAKIKANKSLYSSLVYNERKLSAGKAQCLLAENFAKDLDQLTWKDKIFPLKRRNELNQQALRKTFHISVNFHPSDQLSNTDLQEITKEYMEKMGLSRQPYLVYRHDDSAHPHVHVVATAIQRNGRRIHLTEKRFHRSASISRELEESRSLIVWGKGMTQEEKLSHDKAQKIIYAQKPTTPSLSNVVNLVVPTYKYTSLEELNAVLNLYHVEAYRGKENSHLYQRRGLFYRVLDEQGHPTGSQIKASIFYSKPILKRLEKNYVINRSETQRLQYQQRVTTAIDWTLVKNSLTLENFQKALKKERISAVLKRNPDGVLQNIYYVDHQTKAVFDASNLGGRYTTTAMLERCLPDPGPKKALSQELSQQQRSNQERQQQEQELDFDD